MAENKNCDATQLFQRQLIEMDNRIMETREIALRATNDISAHERVCTERYNSIKEGLDVIPRIFVKLEGLQKVANMFTGAMFLVGTGFVGVMVSIIVYIAKQ